MSAVVGTVVLSCYMKLYLSPSLIRKSADLPSLPLNTEGLFYSSHSGLDQIRSEQFEQKSTSESSEKCLSAHGVISLVR